MADITKDTFNRSKYYARVIFQQGRDVADFELNELQQIMQNTLSTAFKTLFGNVCFYDGLKVVVTSVANKIRITRGSALFNGMWYELVSDTDIALPDPPSAGTRVDKVYARFSLIEVTSVHDPDIIDEENFGFETAIREKMNVEFLVGGSVPGDTETYTHVYLADVTRRAGVTVVQADDITDKRNVVTNSVTTLLKQGVLNEGGVPFIKANTLANRPVPTNSGMVYIVIDADDDAPCIFHDTGTWVPIGGSLNIYVDSGTNPDYTGVKYKLVVKDGQPYMEVIEA